MYPIEENFSIGKTVTFIPNKKLPIYNWFYYKEGFSRQFIEYAYNNLNISKSEIIVDPFLGSGNTALYSKEKGNMFYGVDVNLVSLLAARAKTYDYNIERLKQYFKLLTPAPIHEEIDIRLVKEAFPKYVLEWICGCKKEILSKIDERKYQEFFLLALMNTSTITTYAMKEGGSIKINKRKRFPPVKEVFKRTIKKMLTDLTKIKFNASEDEIHIMWGDARELSKYVYEGDVIITSPPYLNKIEYTNVYVIEQYLFINKKIKKPAVRSYIGEYIEEKEDVFGGKYPMNDISRAYFKDMYSVIKEIKKIGVKRGAIVIGDGCFPNGVVNSDILVSDLLERQGYEIEKIERVNKRWCMKNRVVKVAPMYESIVWFK